MPANNPRLVTLVVVNKPKNGYYGGDVAAPAFEQIMAFVPTPILVLSASVR